MSGTTYAFMRCNFIVFIKTTFYCLAWSSVGELGPSLEGQLAKLCLAEMAKLGL